MISVQQEFIMKISLLLSIMLLSQTLSAATYQVSVEFSNFLMKERVSFGDYKVLRKFKFVNGLLKAQLT